MKEHRSIRCILLDFNIHMNLTLDDTEDVQIHIFIISLSE